jgi:hypothetical protein
VIKQRRTETIAKLLGARLPELAYCRARKLELVMNG